MKILYLDPKEANEWLLKKHYAHRIPCITDCFGLYHDSFLMGVCTFGIPPSRALCIGICGEDYAKYVFELNRLVIDDEARDIKKNVASYFVGACLRMLKDKHSQNNVGLIVVSYADTSMGHVGKIYQATNFIYTGLSAKRTERYDIDNPNKHSKTVTTAKGVNYQDLAVRDRPRKHRYIKMLGNKRQRKQLERLMKYKKTTFPKGETKRYNASYTPITQITMDL